MRHQFQGFGFALGAVDAGHFFALRGVDGGLGFTFGFFDFGFTLARSKVDLLDFQAFGLGDAGAFFAFGGDLRLHGAQDFLRRHEVFDFVAQYFHAPGYGGFVERGDHSAVDVVALFKGFVQFHAADDGT